MPTENPVFLLYYQKLMPLPVKTRAIGRTCMREEVYNTILSWIVEGKLCPGEKLLDKELAESMGVSRTPVREALRRLEDKNLVESSANRWTRVAEVSVKESEKIYPIIWTMEELAVAEAIELLTVDDFKKMEQANLALAKAIDKGDPVACSKADLAFHDVFVARSGNPYLPAILQDLKIQCRRVEAIYFKGIGSGRHSLAEHNGILDALKSQDLALAQSRIRGNWQSSLKRFKMISSENPLPAQSTN
jgi:DNA-binding GntR family transcriptional regulator